MIDKLTSVDIICKISSYCDLPQLLCAGSLNRTWYRVVNQIFEEYAVEENFLRIYTYRQRIDYSTIKKLCISAWKAYLNPIGRFLLVGGCFVGDIPNDSILLQTKHRILPTIAPPSSTTAADASSNTIISSPSTSQSDYLSVRCFEFNENFLPRKLGASSMTTTCSGERLLLGGWSNEKLMPTADILYLNPRDLQQGWRFSGLRIPTELCFTASTTLLDGQIVISGGGDSPYRGAGTLSSCYGGNINLDQNTIDWYTFPNLRARRCGHSLVTLLDGSMVALGGYSGGETYLNSAERLDRNGNQWNDIASMIFRRSGAGSVVGNDGCIYVAGGSPDGTIGLRSFERIDIREGKWVRLPDMRKGRGYTAASIGPQGRIYVSGGLDSDEVTKSIDCYDVRKGTWIQEIHRDNTLDHIDGMNMEEGWDDYDSQFLVRAGHQMIYLWE